MAYFVYEYYVCPQCKQKMFTKCCPSCKVKTKGQGRVCIRFRMLEDYKTVLKRTKWYATKKEAQAEYVNTIANAPKISYRASDGTSYKFEDLIDNYLIVLERSVGHSTFYEKSLLFKKYITPWFKGQDVRKIKKKNLMDWQVWVLSTTYSRSKNGPEQNISLSHFRKIRSCLYSFFEWLHDIYDILNLLKEIKAPKNIVINKVTEKDFLELSEFAEFQKVTKDDYFWDTFFFFMFHTGMRPGEARAFSENDYHNGMVFVNKTISRTKGGVEYVGSMPKNKKPYSKPISKPLQERLDEFIKWKRDNGLSSKFMFPIDDSFIGKHKLERTLKEYMSKTNINKHITPHCFRHSYVAMLIDMDCNPKVVADMTGDTEKVIMERYSHLYANKRNRVIDKLNKYLEQNAKFCV